MIRLTSLADISPGRVLPNQTCTSFFFNVTMTQIFQYVRLFKVNLRLCCDKKWEEGLGMDFLLNVAFAYFVYSYQNRGTVV